MKPKLTNDELRELSNALIAADLRTVISLLRRMADTEPVMAVPLDVARNAVEHVGMANYAGRQREAESWLREAEFEAFTHTTPQPQPENDEYRLSYMEQAYEDEPQPQPERQPMSEPIHGFGDYGAKILVNGEPTQMSRGMQRLWDHPLNDIVMQEEHQPANEPTEAQIEIRNALAALLLYVESNECRHETTHRGGAIWTICDDCDRGWADDEGGFEPYEEPAVITRARAALAARETK